MKQRHWVLLSGAFLAVAAALAAATGCIPTNFAATSSSTSGGTSQSTSSSTSTTVGPPETIEDFEAGMSGWTWNFQGGENGSAEISTDTTGGASGSTQCMVVWFPLETNCKVIKTDPAFGTRWSANNYSQLTVWIKASANPWNINFQLQENHVYHDHHM